MVRRANPLGLKEAKTRRPLPKPVKEGPGRKRGLRQTQSRAREEAGRGRRTGSDRTWRDWWLKPITLEKGVKAAFHGGYGIRRPILGLWRAHGGGWESA